MDLWFCSLLLSLSTVPWRVSHAAVGSSPAFISCIMALPSVMYYAPWLVKVPWCWAFRLFPSVCCRKCSYACLPRSAFSTVDRERPLLGSPLFWSLLLSQCYPLPSVSPHYHSCHGIPSSSHPTPFCPPCPVHFFFLSHSIVVTLLFTWHQILGLTHF